jgi:hypothetical protein
MFARDERLRGFWPRTIVGSKLDSVFGSPKIEHAQGKSLGCSPLGRKDIPGLDKKTFRDMPMVTRLRQ